MILFQVINFYICFSRISPKVALLTMITGEFVPLFYEKITENNTRPKTKGVQVDAGSIVERVKNGMQLLQVLLICSLEDALQTADSMQARGFGVTKRTTYIRYRMERRDWYTLSYLSILFIIAIICSNYGGGKVNHLSESRCDTFLSEKLGHCRTYSSTVNCHSKKSNDRVTP